MIINRNIVLGLIVLVGFLGLIFVQESFGFMNEPTGYKGNKWGTPIDQIDCGLKEVVAIEKIKFKAFTPDIKLQTMDIMFLFLGNKFAAYSLKVKDPRTTKLFTMLCYKAHGQPSRVIGGTAIWESEATIIELDVVHGIATVGSATGTRSLEALFEWYESQGGDIKPEKKVGI